MCCECACLHVCVVCVFMWVNVKLNFIKLSFIRNKYQELLHNKNQKYYITHTHTHTHTHIHSHTHTLTYTYTLSHTHAHIHTRTYTHTQTHAHMHIHTHSLFENTVARIDVYIILSANFYLKLKYQISKWSNCMWVCLWTS